MGGIIECGDIEPSINTFIKRQIEYIETQYLNNIYVNMRYFASQLVDWVDFLKRKLVDYNEPKTKIEMNMIQNNIHNYTQFINLTTLLPKQPEKSSNNEINAKQETPLLDYFTIENIDVKVLFIKELKQSFNIEEGKSIRALIEVLKDEKIIHIPSRKNKPFWKVLKIYFERNIGSYNSLFDKNVFIDGHDKGIILQKLTPLFTKVNLKKVD